MPIIHVYRCEVCTAETRDANSLGWSIRKRRWFMMGDDHQSLVYCPKHSDKATVDGDAMGVRLFDALLKGARS